MAAPVQPGAAQGPPRDDGPWLITTAEDLAALVEELSSAPRYALDTEFHRERTYWPRLALVQVAWEPGPDRPVAIALVDPLAVDPEPLAKVLAGPAVMVAHAASQDLEVLARACQLLPSTLFDTQVAAGFLGYGSASLASLVDRFLHVRLAKGDRLTDWSRRPLSASQLSYAASDVAHLLALADVISELLASRGRLVWAEEECSALLARPVGATDPDEAWWKLRDNRQLQGTARSVAQEVAAWRERKARQHDVQPRMVLPDLALLSIAHSPPPNAEKLHETRGIDARYLRGGADQEIMAAVARGRPAQRAAEGRPGRPGEQGTAAGGGAGVGVGGPAGPGRGGRRRPSRHSQRRGRVLVFQTPGAPRARVAGRAGRCAAAQAGPWRRLAGPGRARAPAHGGQAVAGPGRPRRALGAEAWARPRLAVACPLTPGLVAAGPLFAGLPANLAGAFGP